MRESEKERERKRTIQKKRAREKENEIDEKQEDINNFIRKLNNRLVCERLLQRRKKRVTFCNMIEANR